MSEQTITLEYLPALWFGLDLLDDAPLLTGQTDSAPVSDSLAHAKPSGPEIETRLLADLIKLLQHRGSLSSSEAQAALGLDAAALRPVFAFLVASGHIRTEGECRGMRYILNNI